MKRIGLVVAGWIMLSASAVGGEVGFVEDFALARDRATALRQLIPGTEDYYYYHCLHFLNTEQFEKVEAQVKPWHERFGQTQRLTEIQARYVLLTYDRDPKRALEYFRQHLNLRFDHQKQITDGPPNLPTALDPQLISRRRLLNDSLNRWSGLDNFENDALDWLAGENLNWQRRRVLLQRLTRPDVPNLPRLIADDLAAQHSGGFGQFAIHRQLTLAQLGELLKLRPALQNQLAFVHTWIGKLQPGADEDWRRDPALTQAYLDRLLGYVRTLSAAHNSLKANILYHRLVLDRSRGTFNKDLFIEYLKLPRQQGYMAKAMLESTAARQYPVDLNADLSAVTLTRPIGGDEPLVRSYLKHFFADARSPQEFEPYINDVYLKHLFAETKIELGIGEPEEWASQLPPEMFRALKDRVDIDFAPTNKTSFAADEPVALDLHIKNVPTLIVKVFEINTKNYYRTQQREVDTDVMLDGLVANTEKSHAYPEPPLRRVGRKFEFPQLNKPGVYVIDFIGSGKSSRALVRKGRLRTLVTLTSAGQMVRVVDDSNKPVQDATVWLGGQEFGADPNGNVLVPYSTNPGRRPVVISRGDFACLDYLNHQPEGYALVAGIHVDREALLAQRVAAVLVRPSLTINGLPVSVKLLEEVKLTITATDLDGIATTTMVPDFKLFEDRESVHEFRTPPRLAALSISLQAKVKSLSRGNTVDLAANHAVTLNGIDKTDKIEDLHIAKFAGEYVIEVLGRTGEVKPDRPVRVGLKHRDFKELVQVMLKSDAQGRVRLGALADVSHVTATGPEGVSHSWSVPTDHHSYRQVLHAKAGDTVMVPYLNAAANPSRDDLALFEVRGSNIRADKFASLAVNNGMLELRGLAPGDYDLWLKRSGERIRIRIVDGPVVSQHVLGKLRHMELAGLKPVQIEAITATGDAVTVKLRDASTFTRVHVFASRYRPEYSAYGDLAQVRAAELGGVFPAHAESVYLTGRNIGDEYRYVLDRQQMHKFPGNMLDRPQLLLNPWAVRTTETGEQAAAVGDEFRPRGVPAASAPAPKPESPRPEAGGVVANFANLDFLADAAAVLVNLIPDKDGTLKIDRKLLGPHAMVHVVAVDPLSTTARSVALEDQRLRTLDLRLRAGLDPQAHFTQQKQVTMLANGQTFVLNDPVASRFEAYDSLAKVHTLYSTLTKDPKLAEFAFVLRWPSLKAEEKKALYSKHACHELSFFIAKKDPEFFRTVVKPYLANKKDKTFLDHWLLEDNVSDYLQPWPYGRLNTVERILLAQRSDGEPGKTARHLNDLWKLLPPNLDRSRVLFETAVRASVMDSESVLEREKASALALHRAMEPSDKLANGAAGRRSDSAVAMPPGSGPMGGVTFGGAKPAAPGQAGYAGGRAAESKASEEMAKLRSRSGRSAGKDKADADEDRRQAVDDRGAVDKKENFYFEQERKLGTAVRQLYRRLEATQEWAENNYYKLPIQQQLAELVKVNPFWLDYARHDGKGPFFSKHIADPTHNFSEMMFALAVLDLPFTAGKHTVKFDGGKMSFTAAGPVIAFHEEVRPAAPAAGPSPVLVSQNFYRNGDRYREENGERSDKFITGEFIAHTVYGSQVVVTNPSPSRQRLAVLVQVPVGAVPVANGQFTKTILVDLEPYRTQTIDTLFYFPTPGNFANFPVHVGKNEALVAFAKPAAFGVVAKPTKFDTESWDYVSQNGTNEQVLAFLTRENVHALNLEMIAWRMKDRAFFEAVTTLLRERHAYHPTLWSYAIMHNVPAVADQFLKHTDAAATMCAGPISSPLLTLDAVARHDYEHLEYKPLVNARTHALGQRRQIVNDRLFEQYHRYMKQLTYHRQLSDDDRLAVTYYLLLQDRIEEALHTFAEVRGDNVATRVQYDYCAAYLDMYLDEPKQARTLAMKYANYPVDRWRNAFATVAQQLDEVEGKSPAIADAADRNQNQAVLAAKEPVIDFAIDAKAIQLGYQNVETVRINYYLMDVELLFSRNPFVQGSGSQFGFIKPNLSQEVKLPANQVKTALPLPEQFLKRNVMVEVTAGGKTKAVPYYANAMDVKLTENYGQLKVTDAGARPLSKVYVKTYVRLADGTVKFHKDGYTDHRGRFDYTSVSTPEKAPPAKYSILVLSDAHGALIREANPPVQ